MGGLGNQMFQYAAGRRLALKHETDLKLDISWFRDQSVRKYSMMHFNIREIFASPEEVATFRVSRQGFRHVMFRKMLGGGKKPLRTHIRESQYHFDPRILRLHGDIYLDGYWQTEKYFKDIESILREELTFKTPAPPKDLEVAQVLARCNSVSLHVRRGDYVENGSGRMIHAVCDEAYYHSSADYISKKTGNAHFFVFSDDTGWVRANLRLPFPMTIVERDDFEHDVEDLRLMSNCKHHVIANSSFSWWGAWLDPHPGKIVVAPKRWFREPKFNSKDLIPPGWILI
jgi:hypothetical protein